MRKVLLLIVMVAVCMLGGCESEQAYWNAETSQIVTVQEYEVLPPSDQLGFAEVTIRQINPETSKKITSGINAAKGGVEIVRPFIPEPYATLLALFAGAAATGWQTFKKRKIKDRLDGVELGAEITKATVNKVIRPLDVTWKSFKVEQELASANTNAIMPDKL